MAADTKPKRLNALVFRVGLRVLPIPNGETDNRDRAVMLERYTVLTSGSYISDHVDRAKALLIEQFRSDRP